MPFPLVPVVLELTSPGFSPLFTFSPEQLTAAGLGEEGGVPQHSSCRVLRIGATFFLPLSGGTLISLITSLVGVGLTILRFLKPLGSNKRKHLSEVENVCCPEEGQTQIDVLLAFNFAVIFILMYFRVRQVINRPCHHE